MLTRNQASCFFSTEKSKITKSLFQHKSCNFHNLNFSIFNQRFLNRYAIKKNHPYLHPAIFCRRYFYFYDQAPAS